MSHTTASLAAQYLSEIWNIQVVKSQMDQEADIMKQSMARQEAAQAAAEEAGKEEEEPGAGPLRTVSSGARGVACSLIIPSAHVLIAPGMTPDHSLYLSRLPCCMTDIQYRYCDPHLLPAHLVLQPCRHGT